MARVLARVLARAGRDREDEARDVAFVFLDLDLMGIISPSELVGGVLEVFVVKEKSFSEREELDATWKCRDNPFSLFEDDVENPEWNLKQQKILLRHEFLFAFSGAPLVRNE